ncbi:MAG: hypothetical protein WAW80_03845 [Candidatus Saccharimonadales bacterium]
MESAHSFKFYVEPRQTEDNGIDETLRERQATRRALGKNAVNVDKTIRLIPVVADGYIPRLLIRQDEKGFQVVKEVVSAELTGDYL